MTEPVPCKQCSREVEPERRCYATPVCFACLPPPEPLSTFRFATEHRAGESSIESIGVAVARQSEKGTAT